MPTDSSVNMTPDIYDLANYVNTLKKEYHTDVNEDTLMVGLYGMIGELFSNIAQNNIVMASEFANESIPTKAKFEKNIISHALNLGINTLNATPAKMDVFLTFIEDEIIEKIGSDYGEFIFDCDNKIYFGDFEFHPDYDIVIKRVKLNNGSYTYTAMYNMTGEGVFENPISDIDNPYLTPPVVIEVNGTRYLFIACTLRQVEKTEIYKKVLTDNTIASKTTNFEYESQLAAFTVDVTNENETVHLIPVYEGLVNSNSLYPYIWYTYLDTTDIRIKFDKNSYSPRVNSDVKINLMTTQGENGNFKWNSTNYPVFSFDSERLGYTNLTTQVRPINNESMYGTNKKTIEELKRVIAVEALARGSITNTTDLKNYFNAIDSSESEMYFYKKRDNGLERLYYSYIVMKDSYSNIVPTNTIDIVLDPNMLEKEGITGRLILRRGQILKLETRVIDEETGETDTFASICEVTEDTDMSDGFYYIIPYNFAICVEPLYGVYFLTTMNVTKNLEFVYINEECQYQYISTYLRLNRAYLSEPDTYKVSISVEQNLTDDSSMIEVDVETGEIISSNVKAFMVIYNEDKEPYRWLEAELTDFNPDAKIFDFVFTMTSNDLIDAENNIRVDKVYQVGDDGSAISYGYFPSNCSAMIHIVTKQPTYSTGKSFTDIKGNLIDIKSLIPVIEDDWCITNSYSVINGIDFFYDYSEIIYSTVDVIQNPPNEEGVSEGYTYRIGDVPVIKYNYFKTEDMVEVFFGELLRRKYYIDEALNYLEDSFGMNFKFFNTYGPAHMFTLNNGERLLDRINISLKFELALRTNYDENIVQYILNDIKAFVESISEINSLHMSNLVTQITKTYQESIIFFEFIGLNNYGPGEQHIYAMKMPDNVITPEILNINTRDDQTPDITITIV